MLTSITSRVPLKAPALTYTEPVVLPASSQGMARGMRSLGLSVTRAGFLQEIPHLSW